MSLESTLREFLHLNTLMSSEIGVVKNSSNFLKFIPSQSSELRPFVGKMKINVFQIHRDERASLFSKLSMRRGSGK